MTSEWQEVRLGELCVLTKGKSATLKTPPGDYPLIVTGPAPLSSDKYQFDGEAVCIPMVSSTGHGHASLKRVHYARGKFAVANIITAAQVIDPTICDTKYLFHYLQHFKDELIVTRMQGTANVSISQKVLAEVPVVLPPLPEQRRIVDLIGALDEAIESAEAASATGDGLWWSLTQALEESVVGVAHQPLGVIAEIGGGLTKNKKDFEADDLVEVPYLRVANVHRRFLDLTDVATIRTTREKLERLRLQSGDLVLNEGGDKDKLGRGSIWRGEMADCIHQNHVFRVRITDAAFRPEFVSAWANSYGQRWFETFGTQTTGIASISKSTLSRFPVPSLPLDQQDHWVDALESSMSVQSEAKSTATSLRSLRTEVLGSLLSGAPTIPESYDELISA